MQTGVLVGLAALAMLSVGVVGASGVMAPAGGVQGGMGGGMMGGGSGMNGGTCGCQSYESCQQYMYDHNDTWDHHGMMP